MRSDGDFAIFLDRNELMSSDMSASEEALGSMTCEALGQRTAPQLLIGGYGMGFTLRAALAALPPEASVIVAEIVPEIIAWARGPMHHLTANSLVDPRVMIVMEDVALLIDSAEDAYDAILLDVDNGPEGLTRRLNDQLYSREGLHSAMMALKPHGILAVWSAAPDAAFALELERAGFAVTEAQVNAVPGGEDLHHVIWFARKP
ncbi:MAG: spermidine synthase [Novosphingobium sp.]